MTRTDPPARHAAAETEPDAETVVAAEGLTLITRRGPVFGPVDLGVAAHEVALITGPSGSGRSSLLLAVTGRMSMITGRLRVGGVDGIRHPRAVRKITAVARIAGLVDLEPQLTVAESITERTLIDAVRPDAGLAEYRRLTELIGLHLDPAALVDDLPQVDRTLLAVVLAALRPAELIVLDDLDRAVAPTEQTVIIDGLLTLCADGHTIIASTTADPAPDHAHHTLATIPLGRPSRLDPTHAIS